MTGKARVPRRLRELVAMAAGYRCGYCRTPQTIAGFRLSMVEGKYALPARTAYCTRFQQ
jgi:hypothetical protein